jgi:starch-binding outer membrane protein, SusD/RagB family
MRPKYFLYLFLAVGISACTKDLNQSPISNPSVDNFYRNTADFQQAVNGIYQALHAGLNLNLYDYAVRQFELSEVRSDNVYAPGTGAPRDYVPVNNFDKTLATNPYITGLWNDNFNGILRANIVLDKLNPEVVPDNTTRDRFEGEAKFLRAFFYFDLVRWVGKVPIFDHVATPTEALTIPRSSVADVYNLIISDLQAAIAKLPTTYTAAADRGRATSYAAKAMLALVYLTRSGPTFNIDGPGLGTTEYSQALTLLNDLIGKFTLQATYASVFSYTNKNNSEIIFDMQNMDLGNTTNTGLGTELPNYMYEQPYGLAIGIGFDGGVVADAPKPPSNNLLSSFEPTDTRDNTSILMSYVNQQGSTVNRPQFVKFLDLTRKPLIRFNFACNYPILRYADVLLMKAEAILRGGAGGTQAEVDGLVNQVRNRAGLPNISNVNLDILLNERRHEFMAEGKRWHDLVRTGKVLTVMAAWDAADDIANKMAIPTANDIIYPIPQAQLSVNPGLYTQNPGY